MIVRTLVVFDSTLCRISAGTQNVRYNTKGDSQDLFLQSMSFPHTVRPARQLSFMPFDSSLEAGRACSGFECPLKFAPGIFLACR
jgi:hypothetical protein